MASIGFTGRNKLEQIPLQRLGGMVTDDDRLVTLLRAPDTDTTIFTIRLNNVEIPQSEVAFYHRGRGFVNCFGDTSHLDNEVLLFLKRFFNSALFNRHYVSDIRNHRLILTTCHFSNEYVASDSKLVFTGSRSNNPAHILSDILKTHGVEVDEPRIEELARYFEERVSATGDAAYHELVKLHANGRTVCNCGCAYYSPCGTCEYGCSANQITARNEIATNILREMHK